VLLSLTDLFSCSAQQIWDMVEEKKNPSEFATAVNESDLASFNFTDAFVFDLWATIDDVRAGRVPEQIDRNEQL
jgi:PDZ domain-containing protein GIPC